TCAVPALAMSLAWMLAVALVGLLTLVARGLPFHCTDASSRKLLPLTTRSNPAPPALAVHGLSAVSCGAGLQFRPRGSRMSTISCVRLSRNCASAKRKKAPPVNHSPAICAQMLTTVKNHLYQATPVSPAEMTVPRPPAEYSERTMFKYVPLVA